MVSMGTTTVVVVAPAVEEEKEKEEGGRSVASRRSRATGRPLCRRMVCNETNIGLNLFVPDASRWSDQATNLHTSVVSLEIFFSVKEKEREKKRED